MPRPVESRLPLRLTVPTGETVYVTDRGLRWRFRSEIVYPDKHNGIPHVQLVFDAPREVLIGRDGDHPMPQGVTPLEGTRAAETRKRTAEMMKSLTERAGQP